jgi:hypothetical protein
VSEKYLDWSVGTGHAPTLNDAMSVMADMSEDLKRALFWLLLMWRAHLWLLL